MSYDVWIGDRSMNYTSNVSQLFYDHIPAKDSAGGLHEIAGKTGLEAALILGEAFGRIHRTKLDMWRESTADKVVVGEPDFCAKYDSPNGWGSTVGGILFLAEIMSACIANPALTVSVSA